ncbi:MAG: hypothetical protein M1822_007045 [Bathelium mastoideum]|nr:MAG: hypothetical protein M1822_007045 [Bathelium mastoideum]
MQLNPNEISTQCVHYYHAGMGLGNLINYADLNSPVPWGAYLCMRECGTPHGPNVVNACPTLYDDYVPLLAFPTAVNNLQPEWKSCTFQYDGNIITDPPYALTPYQVAADPTSSFMPTPTTARPAPPPITSIPAQTLRVPDLTTSSPVHTASPTDPANPSKVPTLKAPEGSGSSHSSRTGNGDNSREGFSSSDPAKSSPSPINGEDAPPEKNPGAGSTPEFPGANPHQDGGDLDSPPTGQSADPHTSDNGNPQPTLSDVPPLPTTAPLDLNSPQLHSLPVPAAIVPIGSTTYTTVDGTLDLGTQTLHPGGPDATVSGHVVSLASQGVVADSRWVAYSGPGDAGSTDKDDEGAAVAVFTVHGQTHTAYRASESGEAGTVTVVIIDGIPIAAGAAGQLNDGVSVSDAGSGLVIDGSSTVRFASPWSSAETARGVAVFTMGGKLLTAIQRGGVVDVDGTSMSVGGPLVTIGGEVISAELNGLLVGTRLVDFNSGGNANGRLGYVFIDSNGAVETTSAIPGDNGVLVVDGKTLLLRPGDPAATENVPGISVASDGLRVGSMTAPLSGVTREAEFTDAHGFVRTAFEVAHAGSEDISVDGKTLSVGGPAVTLDGQVISVGSAGLIVGGSKTVLFRTTDVPAAAITKATFDIGSSKLTAIEDGGDAVVIDGITLSVGGPVATIDGALISDGPNGVVTGASTTVPFVTTETTSSRSDGGHITAVQVTTSDTGSTVFHQKAGLVWVSWSIIWVFQFLLARHILGSRV